MNASVSLGYAVTGLSAKSRRPQLPLLSKKSLNEGKAIARKRRSPRFAFPVKKLGETTRSTLEPIWSDIVPTVTDLASKQNDSQAENPTLDEPKGLARRSGSTLKVSALEDCHEWTRRQFDGGVAGD